MGYDKINTRVITAIRRYADEHCPTGGFLRAVLSNNLLQTIGMADWENSHTLGEIIQYCYNEIPGDCWGSPEKVQAWLAARKQDA